MSIGRGWRLTAALLALPWPVSGQTGAGPYGWGRVTAVASGGGSVTIDAGSSEGMRQWTRVEIVRRGRAVAVLKVLTLGAHQTTCEFTSRSIPLVAGDSARFLRSGRPRGEVASPSPAPPVPGPTAPVTKAPPPAAARRDSVQPAPVSPPARQATPPVAAPSPPPAAQASAPVAPPVTRDTAAAKLPPGQARVTFVTTSSAYVSAGKAEGLVEGSRVDVVRRGRSVAVLKAAFVSTHQSACRIESMSDSVAVGDSVRFQPVGAMRTVAERGEASSPGRPSSRSAAGRLRGRVGVYFLSVQSNAGRVSQPSGDFRLSGFGLGGSALGIAVDVRSRRVVQAFTGSPTNTTDLTRVYQAAVFWQAPGSPFRFTTGRQYAPGISSVGLVDGGAAEVSLASWDYGVFAGMQPEPSSLGFSSHVAQLGGYLRVHSRPGSLAHWSATLGASGAYLDGHTNREFGYLQANFVTRRVSVYAVQEIDYYRPWRRVSGEPTVSPTSTFANVQVQVVNGISLTGGFDNRRSVRLGSEFADTVFDDAFRRGVWAGVAARVARHFQATFDARTNHDSASGTANLFTLGLGVDRLTTLGVSVRTRSTRYTTPARQGWLNSITAGVEPFGRGSLQLTSGWRSEHGTAPTSVRWLSADMDVSVVRSLFVILSGYRERGGLESHDLIYAGASFRF